MFYLYRGQYHLIVGLLLWSPIIFAEAPWEIEVPHNSAVDLGRQDPPPILFHWTRIENLSSRLALSDASVLPLANLKSLYGKKSGFEEHGRGKMGLFTWCHPVTGMGCGRGELYGNPKPVGKKSGEIYQNALIAIELQPKVRMMKSVTFDHDEEKVANFESLESADLVYHEHHGWHILGVEELEVEGKPTWVFEKEKTLWYTEWVLQNSKSVKNFTADPSVLKPLLRAHRKFLESGGTYSMNEDHFRKFPFGDPRHTGKHYLPRVDDYLAMENDRIPEVWRRPMKLPDSCLSILSRLANGRISTD